MIKFNAELCDAGNTDLVTSYKGNFNSAYCYVVNCNALDVYKRFDDHIISYETGMIDDCI